jgi:8-oxo-dGTP pyrophosphatase MutT (NUDIX family)
MSKKVDRSGVIPYIVEDGQIKMLFMRPSDPKFGGDTFQIAKGKHEEGESALEAGLREAGEELGLFTGNIIEAHDLGTFLGRTTVHVAKIKDKDLFGDPCDETEEVRWMTVDEFDAVGRDLHKPVVRAAIRLIKEQENIK